jgi:hypothetical protein
MTVRTISLWLDDDATHALAVLTRDGESRAEAIRVAVLDTARRRTYELAAADAALIAGDERDRREVRAVQDMMEVLSPER